VSDETERLVAEIPPELKELVDADRRTNKEVVEAALWREFGGERVGALERRIDEKERRISMLESERNERDREIEQEREELEALENKIETTLSHKEEQIEDYARRIKFTEMKAAGLVLDTPEDTVELWADQAGVTVDELVAKAKELYNA